MVSFALMVLSNTKSLADFMLPFGVTQKTRYLTSSDSGVVVSGSSLYVTVTASVRLAATPSTVISLVLVVLTGIPLQDSLLAQNEEKMQQLGVTALMCHGRDVHGWVRQLDTSSSTCRWSVEVYVSHGPHQEATVVFGYIEGSFLVSRTGDARDRSTVGGVGRGSSGTWIW